MVSAYRIERAIGSGGMGCVFRARHALERRHVALKVLREDQVRQERAVERMMREAQILATVGHPGIPALHECGLLPDGRPWIAMELVEGRPLLAQLADGPLAHDVVPDILEHVASVLAAAHARGFVHRDLKPENILVTPDDLRFPVRVIDWGIAHEDHGPRWTDHNEAVGTPLYMSPEQARGEPTDGASDIYGLGVVAFHALTGRTPFTGKSSIEILVQHLNRTPPSLAPRCPEAPLGLVELVERMLAKQASDRPSAADVRARIVELRETAAAPIYELFTIETGGDDDDTSLSRVS